MTRLLSKVLLCETLFCTTKASLEVDQHPVFKRVPSLLFYCSVIKSILCTKDIVIGTFSILMASNRFRKLCFASKTNRKTPSIRSARVTVEFGKRTRVRKRQVYKITEILRFAQETPYTKIIENIICDKRHLSWGESFPHSLSFFLYLNYGDCIWLYTPSEEVRLFSKGLRNVHTCDRD